MPGLCSISFRDLDVDAIIDLAAGAGLEAIEWGADRHVRVGDLARATAIADRCRDAGLACPSYGSYLGFDDTKGDAAGACETAAALGADNIRVWARFGADHTAADDARLEVVAEITSFAAEAARHDLTVGIECHGWTLTDTAASARRLVADVGGDNVFAYWQPNYWHEAVNDSPARQLAEFRCMHPDLSNIHVYWWQGMERRPLTEGATTWQPVLAEARQAGRWATMRYAFLEYVPDDNPANLARDAATLRGWLADGAGVPVQPEG